jgi:hypothetical protein
LPLRASTSQALRQYGLRAGLDTKLTIVDHRRT